MYKVCKEEAAPLAQIGGDPRWVIYDPILACAMAKSAARRFSAADLFKEAMITAHRGPVRSAVSVETIIGANPRALTGTGATGRVGLDATPTSTPTPPTSPPPTGWDATVLSGIERELARFVGPLAKVMVRRAAKQVADVRALKEMLAAELGSEAERAAFLREGPAPSGGRGRPLVTLPGMGAPSGPTSAGGRSVPVTPELLEQSTRALLTFIGPIAKVVVRRAAAQATDREQLFLALAEHVARPDERDRFLRALAQLP
jgi:serine/threonine-protein kinase